jgi:microcystin-dependent protein
MRKTLIFVTMMFTCGVNLVARTGIDSTGTNSVLTGPLNFGNNEVSFGGVTRTNWPSNASEINVAFTPTSYFAEEPKVEDHLVGIDSVLTNGPLMNAAKIVEIGKDATAQLNGSIAIGWNSFSTWIGVAMGVSSVVDAGVGIGPYVQSDGDSTVAGNQAVGISNAVAIGSFARAVTNNVALGYGVTNLISDSTRIKGDLIMAGRAVTGAVYYGDGAGLTNITASQVAVPTGGGLEWYGTNLPAGFLWQDGAGYHTSAYPALFNVIGYKFGGSGTNFNVPDRRGKFALGASAVTGIGITSGVANVTLTAGQMPAHTHSQNGINFIAASGLAYGSGLNYSTISATGSAGGGLPHTNMPPNVTVNFIIKY